MKKNLIVFLVLAPLLAITLVSGRVFYAVKIWKYSGPDTIFEIPPGTSFSKINYRLGKEKLISSTKMFHRYSQVLGLMTKFKAGNYIIKKDSNLEDVVKTLVEGKGLTTSVTIPEGKNIYEIAQLFKDKEIIDSAEEFIKLCKDKDFLKANQLPYNSVEGYLYPDTYNFVAKTSPKKVIEMMINQFRKKIQDLDFSSTKLSPNEVIILASVVEKETGAKFERPIIAGVFHNRLKKRMRLQSDPTTIYGIYETYNGNLRKKHLLQKTPYNTYKIPGLPIGPISNPGLASIQAVLNPEKHNFLYFVSQNDGTHVFSKSYREHSRAVDKWQKNRKNRKGKSWRDLKE